MEQITNIVHDTGALDYTKSKAIEESNIAIAALDALPDSRYKEAMVALARIAVDRTN